MLEKLLKNTKDYFWRLNRDGDIVLGRSDIEPKAKVTFTVTKKWANIAPIVEDSPGNYIGKPQNFMKKSKEYELITNLVKEVKAYLKDDPKIDHEMTIENTMKLLQDYYS
ncbi:hypothetical protein [Marinifilum caeruleilacunae]|uniref:Uncharacterized protein n=1 Tax=Marinifilum caeruleilacunae TaxID=2499076 RepID=A0ABX1WXV1_9BACT|nr:hypothetical protein [Marinifilum caeruleilacunae]NOU60922.1 hypothetical protein [Marinifilum caeruleilacunae]